MISGKLFPFEHGDIPLLCLPESTHIGGGISWNRNVWDYFL